MKEEIVEDEKEYKPHNIQGRMGMKVPLDKDKNRRSKRYDHEVKGSPTKKNAQGGTAPTTPIPGDDDKSGNSFSKELARLQFFGAGPKMPGLPNEKISKDKTRGLKLNFEYDPVSKEIEILRFPDHYFPSTLQSESLMCWCSRGFARKVI